MVELVDEVVISEAVGFKKPDRRTFEAAAHQVSSIGGTEPVWMVGDHPVADIAGARNCGFSTGWVSHGVEWMAGWSPTVSADTPAAVLQLVRRAIISGV